MAAVGGKAASVASSRSEMGEGKSGGAAVFPVVVEESSESEGETEPARSYHRRLSTNREIKCSVRFYQFAFCFLSCLASPEGDVAQKDDERMAGMFCLL